MIYIPKNEKDIFVQQTDCENYIYIGCQYHPNYESTNWISFEWHKSYQKNDFSDPFDLQVVRVLDQIVLPCSLNACECQPQLRYNNIIKKWFCNCASSAICTKNDDQDEINELLKWAKGEYTEEKGFCDDPISAILYWNLTMAESYKKIAEDLLVEIKQLKEKEIK